MPSLLRHFSHIYIERGATQSSMARLILEKYPRARVIEIDNYKEIFSRKNQDWRMQKESMKLILAQKKRGFLYAGSHLTPSFENANFFYNTLVMNCLYDCHYCYLQGMYPSANIVVFVNIEDYFSATDKMLNEKSSMYLSISYDTDLLAIENIVPYCRAWAEYARAKDGLTIELRTKSANFSSLAEIDPVENFILAWTLSPEDGVAQYEARTPPLRKRLEAAQQAISAGWKVRVCFDPVLHYDDWERKYGELISTVFQVLPPDRVLDASIGTFRMNREYFLNLRNMRPESQLLNFSFKEGKTVSLPGGAEMTANLHKKLRRYMPDDRIFII